MLTAEGAQLLWAIATGTSSDSLAGATIKVSDGNGNRATTILDSLAVDGTSITLIASFDERDANFEWATAEVLSKDGVVVAREVKDSGRKAEGAVWTLETVLELGVTV